MVRSHPGSPLDYAVWRGFSSRAAQGNRVVRILLTGATSFTGFWFARAMADAGHSVIAAVRGAEHAYSGLRVQRLNGLGKNCQFLWNQTFGSEQFLDAIEKSDSIDVFCHHAADATNYKSQDFDTLSAVHSNSRALPQVLQALKRVGCEKVVLTGSAFEADEGIGTLPLRAFSPYGLSKTLTSEMFRYYTQREEMAFGKFVIANPFGPLEEPRFTDYLLRCWQEGKIARVNTPDYIRDNIHISLLALLYADFVKAMPERGFCKLSPSLYVESQSAFATRFAREIGQRLNLKTPLDFAVQADFSEPMTRINTDRILISPERWQEAAAWDAAADYYLSKFSLANRA
jgi:UDP-glucose 4-epimerase